MKPFISSRSPASQQGLSTDDQGFGADVWNRSAGPDFDLFPQDGFPGALPDASAGSAAAPASALPSQANLVETTDFAGDASTTANLAVGQSAQAVLTAGDHDWFRVNLVAGHTYSFAEIGTGLNRLTQSLLTLRDSSGTQISSDGTSGPHNSSRLTFTPTTSGTYYLDAAAKNGTATGQYGISVTEGTKPNFDYAMGGGSIDTGLSWSTRGTAATITYGFRASPATYAGNGSNISTFQQVSDQEKAALVQLLGLWADVANINFVPVNPTGYTDNATILIANYTDANDGAGAFAYYPGSTASTDSAGDVWLNLNSISTTSIPVGSYSFFAIMHELGHALGLSHPGDYNAAPNTPITYANNAQFAQDDNQYSVMSYFGGSNTGSNPGGFGTAYTPMMFDILEMQIIYGVNTTTRAGNTTYGFNSNAGAIYTFVAGTIPQFCIWDAGGTDTLDCSGFGSMPQTINLNDGTFSSIGGGTSNISIAFGAIIENVKSGVGADTIIGNSVANIIDGGGGGDTETGGAGDDRFVYKANYGTLTVTDFVAGLGTDDRIDLTNLAAARVTLRYVLNHATQSNGNTTIDFGSGSTITLQGVTKTSLNIDDFVGVNNNIGDVNGDGVSDVLWTASNTGDTGYFAMQGNQFTWRPLGTGSTTMNAVGTGDFNGDGHADVLWQNPTNNFVGTWLVQNGAAVWQVIDQGSTTVNFAGVGDFNGDGTSDILWVNPTNNFVGEWQMNNGQDTWYQIGLGSTTMKIAGIGDFDGDGKSDILWQNPDNGIVGMWKMYGATPTWIQIDQGSTTMKIAGTGDFNGDGTTDILWRNDSNGIVGVWFMNNGHDTWQQIGGSPTTNQIASTGDFNGDGTSDILWRAASNGDTGVWLMNPNGTYTGSYLTPVATNYNVVKA